MQGKSDGAGEKIAVERRGSVKKVVEGVEGDGLLHPYQRIGTQEHYFRFV